MPKEPRYIKTLILQNGGVVKTEDGTELISVDESGNATIDVPSGDVSLEDLDSGITFGAVARAAVRHTWDEAAAAADVVTLSGVAATDVIIATINVRGANNPTTVLSAERTGANSVTVTLDQNGENGVTVVSVVALRTAS